MIRRRLTTMEEYANIWAELDAYLIETNPQKEELVKVDHYTCICGSQKLFGADGIPVCTSCGRTEWSYIDDSPEWISGVSEDGKVSDPSRCGMPVDTELFSSAWGSGTVITGRHASYAQKRMARINFHTSMNHKDRALFHAYKDIDSAAKDVLSLPESVVRDAKIMYKKFNGEVLTRGAVRTGIKANCVFYACKLNNVPRTTKEVADAFGIPTKDLSRTSDTFKETVCGKKDTSTVTRPSDVIHRMLNEFDLQDRRPWRIKCLKFAKRLEDCVPLMGKTPNSIAAVIIYKVFSDTFSKHDIVNKCGVSIPTINKIEAIVNKHLEVTVNK
jgi:transcription initiation factor TFIIIB Brf1 subunit/transcription initiation factor TFIIB